jgi:hypothetical protein
MTVGEIWAIIWARTRHATREDDLAAMYAELKELTTE